MKSLWNLWEEHIRSFVYSIPRQAHASVMFTTLGKFQKHPCFKQKTRQFDCLLGCVISLRRETSKTDFSYINILQMPLHQDSKIHLESNPSNYERFGVIWFNTDGNWQTQPDLRVKRHHPFFVWLFKWLLKNTLLPTSLRWVLTMFLALDNSLG